MQTEKWNRARELFQEVLDLPEAERDPHLEAICGADVVLLDRVRRMLAAYDDETAPEPSSASSDPTAEVPTSWPERVGPYRILGALGSGGMGVVYRGQHAETGEVVAVKTLRAPHESLLSGIRREIHALARLDHPGVVRVVDTGIDDGVPWYAMELVEGTSLRDFRTPATDLAAALTLARRLCETLAFLHGEGFVHRDLKPDNVLVRPSGLPVLVDFGIATVFAGREGREVLDALDAAGGTPVYMAPEQIRGETVDARADLYALGCILYELVAGRPPFAGATTGEVMRAHLSAAPAPPSLFAPEVPPALDGLVLRLLAKSPAERIGYADDVAAALARLGAETGSESDGRRPRTYLYRPAFAGRADALAEFDRVFARLRGGEGGVVMVGGESGAGKTRLVVEMGRRAERAGVRVLAGECVPSGARAAGAGSALHALLAPLRHIADRCRERGEAETDALVGARGRLLARYEPALAGLPGQTKFPEPAELPPRAARLRLFEALGATFYELARSRPLLIAIDDLQWADELTLGFVDYLTRREPSADGPLLLVGTYRSEEQSEALRALVGASRVTRVDLGRLEEPAVEAMVGGMLALDPSPAVFSRYLSAQSEGNPFFVAEYLRTAVEERLLVRDEDVGWRVTGEGARPATEADYERLGLPRSVRALVERRLGGLGHAAAETISAAAVVGREAEAELLERVAGLGKTPLFEALDELRRRRILDEAAGGRLRFTHDKLREVAYETVAPERRALLHGAVASALETRPEAERDDLAAELGRHWERAGEAWRARPYYLAGARRSKERYAHEEAERLYRAYLALVDEPTRESVDARNELGWDVLRFEGRLESMAEEHERAGEVAERLADRSALVRSLVCLGYARKMLGQPNEGKACVERALGLLGETGDPELEAMALNELGSIVLDLGAPDEALTLYERAVARFRLLGNRERESTVLGNMGILSQRRWAFDEAAAVYDRALSIKREIGDKAGQMPILGNLGNMLAIKGETAASLACLETALALAREIGDRPNEANVLARTANTHLAIGSLDTARSLFERALSASRANGQPQLEGDTLASLAEVHAEEGRTEEAREAYEQARAIHRRGLWRRNEAAGVLSRATFERRTGALDLGARLADEAEGLFREAGDSVRTLLCACERGHAMLARGASARGAFDEVERAVSALGASPDSDLGRATGRLRRAVEASEANVALLNGECPEDVPERIRNRLGGPERVDG